MDWIIRQGSIPRREGTFDLGMEGERIVAVEPQLEATAAQEIDATGQLLTPTLIDPHVHLDKSLISEVVRDNVSGTLSEAIEIIWEKKKNYSEEDVLERAGRVIEWAVRHGTTFLRSHVDVDTIGGLKPLEGVLAVREKYADFVDIQIVAFPQEGIFQDPGTADLMREAMRLGADLVGGMPYNERTEEDSRRHIDLAFTLAQEFDVGIDMHVDETDDPGARTLQYLADATLRHDYQGRVTAGHTCALAAYNDSYARKVIDLVRRADIQMITNPATNLMLQGRLDRQPIRRGITRVKELLAAGVNVAYGQDCLKDTFYPTFGQADLLEVGLILAHAAQLSMPHEIDTLFEMPTTRSARIVGLEDYGLEPGCRASLNVIAAPTVQEAFRTRPDRRAVFRNGRLLAETQTHFTLHRP